MSEFHYKDGILHAEDVNLAELAKTEETPLYVYSTAHLKKQANALHSALTEQLKTGQDFLICFACKSNSNLAVLSLLKDEGLGCDIVTGGELVRAIKAGVPADKIVFSGVGKTHEDIRQALKHKILQINVESEPELDRIAKIAEELGVTAPVALRFNPDVDAKTHAKITTGKSENKFGLIKEHLIALYKKGSAQSSIDMKGITTHIGSQLTDVSPFQHAFLKVKDLVKDLRDMGLKVETIDIGGGLGITYTDETPPDLDSYARFVKDIIEPLDVKIILEPGRFISGNAGVLISKVEYIKHGENRTYMILDAGMNDLARPSLYDAYHPVIPVDENIAGDTVTYDIVGPVCETGDTFGKAIDLPELKEGDFIAMTSSGGYGYVMASNYNTRPLPAEILVNGGRHVTVKKRQTYDEILSAEIL